MSVKFKFKADPDFTEHPLPAGETSIKVSTLKDVITDVKFNGNSGAFGLKLSNVLTGEGARLRAGLRASCWPCQAALFP